VGVLVPDGEGSRFKGVLEICSRFKGVLDSFGSGLVSRSKTELITLGSLGCAEVGFSWVEASLLSNGLSIKSFFTEDLVWEGSKFGSFRKS